MDAYTNQTNVWSDTGAGNSECKLAIVPVKVKIKKKKVIHKYDFMDPGSSATFCTESLLRQLQITGSRTSMETGMEISGLESSEYLELPEVSFSKFIKTGIPVKL